MKVAERLFAGGRFHEVTTDDVAAAANVGKGTIYRYFQDKDDLFFQIVTNGFDDLCELLQRKVPDRGPFNERLVLACREIRRFFDSRHQLLRMMQSEEMRLSQLRGALRDRWLAKRQKLVAAVAAILAKGAIEGEVRTDIPADILSAMLLGMLRAQAHDLDKAPAAFRGHEWLVGLFCEGIRTPKATAAGAQ
jgi:AcrR family transcriptional regulator